ncbi:glycosyltransferase family 4 protein [Thermotoga sp. KOL6]|uniref:glycosyltransferase family 4 protein n=1 Tax=Thermotoga sp. KOL6 TaxID=126741 RepID=UPI000C7660AD|nr:MraY family glycosyltransferase [Thermotoga sp. KOL6]PLV60350.1 UDP-phosphate alpha-N-acetylglucosaminyl 1-phosphate transferase [Thermotoga sp. KOL6]
MLEFLVSFFGTFTLFLIGKRTGFLDHPSSRKLHESAVPPVGGIAIFLTLLVFGRDNPVFVYSIPMFVLGILDDIFDLSYKVKLTATAFVSLWYVLSVPLETYIFGTKVPQILLLIWILGMVNAFNVIDGIDGLMGGISFLMALLLGEKSLAFSILGFIPMNLPPAKVFLGNNGSFFLGTFLSLASFQFFDGDIGFATLFLGLPFYEIVFSFLRRAWKRKNPFSPDKFHTHHVFCRRLGKWGSFITLLSISAFFNLLGLSEKFQTFFLYLVICIILFFTYSLFQSDYRGFDL